jgi:hypothetical protein
LNSKKYVGSKMATVSDKKSLESEFLTWESFIFKNLVSSWQQPLDLLLSPQHFFGTVSDMLLSFPQQKCDFTEKPNEIVE